MRLESPQLIEEPVLAEGAVDDEDLGGEGVARVLVKQPILVLLHHLGEAIQSWDHTSVTTRRPHGMVKFILDNDYRVIIHVVPNLPLTPKQRLRFSK